MRNTKHVSCLCLLSFEYAHQEKYCILPTTPKFREIYRFVLNQPNHYFRGRPALSMIGILLHLKLEPIFSVRFFLLFQIFANAYLFALREIYVER